MFVVNHTRGEKVMMNPWDHMVSLDVIYSIATQLKWEVGKDQDNITIGPSKSFDECDYLMYDKAGKVIYTPLPHDDSSSDEDKDESSSDADDVDDDEEEEEEDEDDKELVAIIEQNLKIGQKRTSDEAELDYEYVEA